jgi:hypothetical protein
MFRAAIVLFISAIFFSVPASAQTGSNAFTFVALGDMPYRPGDVAKVDRLITAINRLRPAFSIHVGDIKPGGSRCTNEALKTAFDQINTLEQPVVYSIGDNEWTDCGRESAGKFDPRERLQEVRKLAFAEPGQSLGRTRMQVESQAKVMPKFKKFVENQRFSKNGVVFIVPHVVGSDNGLDRTNPEAASEFAERNAANIAWIADGFRTAAETKAKAVVIAFQANPYDRGQSQETVSITCGFIDTVKAISKGAKEFGKPVLVIQGDNHVLEIEQLKDASLKPVPNALRLQVFGDDLVHAMRILVDPDMPGVFGFLPLIVPENGPF